MPCGVRLHISTSPRNIYDACSLYVLYVFERRWLGFFVMLQYVRQPQGGRPLCRICEAPQQLCWLSGLAGCLQCRGSFLPGCLLELGVPLVVARRTHMCR